MIDKLIEILQAEYQIYQELYRLSEEKQKTIIDNEVEELLKIIEQEEKEIEKINQLETKRIDILEKIAASNSLSEGELSFSKLVELLPQSAADRLEDIRQKLLELLEELQQINELNANLIKDSLQLTDYTLQLLTNSNIGKNNTYQKTGQEEESSPQQRNIIDQKV